MAARKARRELAVAALVCAAGAALALWAAGRGWAGSVIERPAPLPDLVTEHTGGELRPWLPALGWVALAGAGALLATRTVVRRLLGGGLVLAGAGIAAGAVATLAGVAEPAPVRDGAAIAAGWPLVTLLGGLLVLAAGVLAVARGAGWPAMGARYERRTSASAGADHASADGGRIRHPADRSAPEELWEALDRGEDPTAR